VSRPSHEVVVTGLGPVTSIGAGVEPFWESILAGRSGARTVDFDWIHGRSFKSRVGAPVPDPDPAACGLTEREAQLLDPVSRYALAAAAMAIEDAGLRTVAVNEKGRELRIEGVDPVRAGVLVGTGIGGLCTLEKSHRASREAPGAARATPTPRCRERGGRSTADRRRCLWP